MRVLMVSEPGVDGVFRYVEALCDFLIGRGVGVHLAYSDRRGSEALPALVDRVEEHGGRTVNLHTANRPAWADVDALRVLVRLAREVRPEVVHSHSSKGGALARVLPLFGVRAAQVYTPHAYVGMRPTPGRLDWLYNLIESRLGRNAWSFVSSTDEQKFACRRLRLPPGRVLHVPNGVDTEKFSPVPAGEKIRLREALGLTVGRPILGFLGRASAQKDPLTLYRAFARAAAAHPIVLFHVGCGELDRELDRLVDRAGLASRVYRRPYMAAPADFYRAVDGFVLTSRYEGFSIAALEALSANLPMILSRAPGNMDLLAQPLSHVWSAEVGDVAGFAGGIARWYEKLHDPAPLNHRRIACERYAIGDTFERVLGLYRELRDTGTVTTAGAKARRRAAPDETFSR